VKKRSRSTPSPHRMGPVRSRHDCINFVMPMDHKTRRNFVQHPFKEGVKVNALEGIL